MTRKAKLARAPDDAARQTVLALAVAMAVTGAAIVFLPGAEQQMFRSLLPTRHDAARDSTPPRSADFTPEEVNTPHVSRVEEQNAVAPNVVAQAQHQVGSVLSREQTAPTDGLTLAQLKREVEALNEKVTYAADVQVANPDDWLRQCAHWFQQSGFGTIRASAGHGSILWPRFSSYMLKDADSGLCTFMFSSAMKDMMWNQRIRDALIKADLLTARLDEISAELPPLLFPSLMSFPHTAKDVVELVSFANKHDMPVSVKNSGHSYSGQSTVGGSLQLNMRGYPEYSKKGIYECADVKDGDAAAGACKLAKARGKKAVARVGGGEGNDSLYRNLGSWNYMVPRNTTYDVLGGAEGMIGAGGGWLLGGGLGLGQERSWGVGVDQVLELEMVLPDGRHVKFGPTEWEEKEGYLYPQTTKVEGLCNVNVAHRESEWQWEKCDDEPVWEDIWFAVRGGGGGTFGVLLSAYHQLHDFEPHYFVRGNLAVLEQIIAKCAWNEWGWGLFGSAGGGCDVVIDKVTSMWADFLMDYMWNPSKLGVEAEVSNKVGYPGNMAFGLPGATSWIALSRGDPTETLIKAWKEYVPTSSYLPKGNYAGLLEQYIFSCKVRGGSYSRLLTILPNSEDDLCQDPPVGSQPVGFLATPPKEGEEHKYSYTPMGHLVDLRGPEIYPSYFWAAMIPVKAITEGDRDYWIDFFKRTKGDGHTLGGNLAFSSDGMTPLPKGYREAAIEISFGPWHSDGNYTFEEDIGDVQARVLSHLGVSDMTGVEAFPGFTEMNHVSGWYAGPLKDDWTKACPLHFSAEERAAKCMSVQETIWGTENLRRLEGIKSRLDPKNLFSVRHGVGNKDVCQADLLDITLLDMGFDYLDSTKPH